MSGRSATSRSEGRRAFGSPTRVLYRFSSRSSLLDRPPLYRKQRFFAVADFDLAFDPRLKMLNGRVLLFCRHTSQESLNAYGVRRKQV
jgi:hypothetical protein